MADDTITRAHLAEAVYQEVGLSRNESAELVEAVLNEMSEALTRGETVKISSFGSFFVGRFDPAEDGAGPSAAGKRSLALPLACGLPRRIIIGGGLRAGDAALSAPTAASTEPVFLWNLGI